MNWPLTSPPLLVPKLGDEADETVLLASPYIHVLALIYHVYVWDSQYRRSVIEAKHVFAHNDRDPKKGYKVSIRSSKLYIRPTESALLVRFYCSVLAKKQLCEDPRTAVL